MGRRIFTSLLIMAALVPVSAQRMPGVSDGTFSPAMAQPEVERSVEPTENGYRVKNDVTVSGKDVRLPRLSERENVVVKEGRVWRYHSDINGNMNPATDIYVDLCFSGTTEIDGMEYANCYVWKTTDTFSEESAALICHMREEDGKVYARYIPDAYEEALEKGIDIIPYAPMMSLLTHDIETLSKKDVLLYDPSLKVGDVLYCTGDEDASQWFVVERIWEIECLGVTRRVWNFFGSNQRYGYYEGIGDIYGLLPIPNPVPITYNVDPWKLVEVIDGSGNVLFATDSVITGIDGVKGGAKVVKESYHTLSGVEMREPSASGVYVRTLVYDSGEVHTEKVIVR